jgi:hypothetical protein
MEIIKFLDSLPWKPTFLSVSLFTPVEQEIGSSIYLKPEPEFSDGKGQEPSANKYSINSPKNIHFQPSGIIWREENVETKCCLNGSSDENYKSIGKMNPLN